MRQILFSEMMSEVNKPNAVFTLGFRKDDGNWSEKKGVVNRSTNLNDRKMMNRSGILKCLQPASDHLFNVTIDLIIEFNGMKIIRPE